MLFYKNNNERGGKHRYFHYRKAEFSGIPSCADKAVTDTDSNLIEFGAHLSCNIGDVQKAVSDEYATGASPTRCINDEKENANDSSKTVNQKCIILVYIISKLCP
uniref:Uncharacterized protein n=1 Tax=Panagrolaimus sp. ES5 TaxID=591445 RepID=A0AC34FLV9_9BILA